MDDGTIFKARKRGTKEPADSDDELVRSILSGDRAAFVVLMRRYDQLLYRTARSILRNDADAEDALQEGYLLAYRAIGSFRMQARLSTWLVRIVANEALGRLRKSRQADVLELDDNILKKWQEENINTAERPDQILSRADLRRLLESKIDALPAAYRVVFVLRAVQEMSVEETSTVLDIPAATVRSRFSRARHLLQKTLSKELENALNDVFPFAGARCDRMVDAVMTTLKRAPCLSPPLATQ
jgi:RNA polymerase sigma-70 factor (ECF subfamily)